MEITPRKQLNLRMVEMGTRIMHKIRNAPSINLSIRRVNLTRCKMIILIFMMKTMNKEYLTRSNQMKKRWERKENSTRRTSPRRPIKNNRVENSLGNQGLGSSLLKRKKKRNACAVDSQIIPQSHAPRINLT